MNTRASTNETILNLSSHSSTLISTEGLTTLNTNYLQKKKASKDYVGIEVIISI